MAHGSAAAGLPEMRDIVFLFSHRLPFVDACRRRQPQQLYASVPNNCRWFGKGGPRSTDTVLVACVYFGWIAIGAGALVRWAQIRAESDTIN